MGRRTWVMLGIVMLAVVTLALAMGTALTGAAPETIRHYDTVSCTTYTSEDTPLSIPDWSSTGVTSTIAVYDQAENMVTGIELTLTISHTFDSDIEAYLIDSEGVATTLFRAAGGGGINFVDTVLQNDAATSIYDGWPPFTGTFRPEADLPTGILAYGDWGLRVIDTQEEQSGSIQGWSIEICSDGPLGTWQTPDPSWTKVPTRTPSPTATPLTPTPSPTFSGAYVPSGVYLFDDHYPADLTTCVDAVALDIPTVAPDDSPTCWSDVGGGCSNYVLLCNMTNTPIECRVLATGHAIDHRPNVKFIFEDWDTSDPGQSPKYLHSIPWYNPAICNESTLSDDQSFVILPERMDGTDEYNAAYIQNWAQAYDNDCGGGATVSSSLFITCDFLPSPTPTRTPTRTVTPTRTPRPGPNMTLTAEVQPYLGEIYPCQAAIPIDWNLRSGAGNNDLYIEIAGTPGVRVSNYQVGLMNSEATPMWERELSNDYTIVGAMVSFADEMYAWAPSPTPTQTPTSTTTPPATSTAGPSPTATTTLTPVPTWTPGPWPTAGIAYLANSSGVPISTREFDASGECGSTPVAYQPVEGEWIWSTPGPGRVPGEAVRAVGPVEIGAESVERSSGVRWPALAAGSVAVGAGLWVWWRRRKLGS